MSTPPTPLLNQGSLMPDLIASLSTNEFADLIHINKAAPSERYSQLLLTQLQCRLMTKPELSPCQVIQAIHELEGGPSCGTKKATQLTGTLLKGLWHKHYIEPGVGSVYINMENAVRDYGPYQIKENIETSQDAWDEARKAAGHLIHITFTQRRADKKYTGEWLIFAIHEGKNYYLCLGIHGADNEIRSLINDHCLSEFPFLQSILES